jgi:hypothetical protein
VKLKSKKPSRMSMLTANARQFEVILFQATRSEIGIMKVVKRINDNEIPSIPIYQFQFSLNLNSTKHWNQLAERVLSNNPHNSRET